MKKSLYLGASMLAVAAAIVPASAADMYRAEPGGYKDGPVYVPANTWTGFYIGANGGYGWSAGDNSVTATSVNDDKVTNTKSFDPSGGFGGGQIGYNLQHDRIVFGIEADLQGSGISDKASVTATANRAITTASAESSLDWFGTVRGRLGYAFDRTLIYATGGLAYGGVKDSLKVQFDGRTSSAAKEDTQTGFVVGGGLEYAISPAWSLKGEYQYIDLGRAKLAGALDGDGEAGSGSAKFDHTYHTARVGLNYHVGPRYEPLK